MLEIEDGRIVRQTAVQAWDACLLGLAVCYFSAASISVCTSRKGRGTSIAS